LPFDLSRVLFIATANWLEPIHPALRDRLEVIELPELHRIGKIADRQTLSRPAPDRGTRPDAKDVKFSDAALRALIREYTREAGVRQLEREIAALARKAARKSFPKTATANPSISTQRKLPIFSATRRSFPKRAENHRIRHRHRPGLDAGRRRNFIH
jgi:ATP-dependent Lon protease